MIQIWPVVFARVTISSSRTGPARTGEIHRVTGETDVHVALNLDGTGRCQVATGVPFLDHMLHQLASHGLLDLEITARGDTHIDDHHTNEDVGIAVGQAMAQALADRRGIRRFGHFLAPLDEALVQVALDCSGRPHLSYDLAIPAQRIGTYDTELVREFFVAVVNNAGLTLHIRQLAGVNSHHIVEACFKAFSRALDQAVEIDPRRSGAVPSSKGVLERAGQAGTRVADGLPSQALAAPYAVSQPPCPVLELPCEG